MARPPSEERYADYVETAQTNSSGPYSYQRNSRKWVRSWSGQPRGRYPVVKDWKNHESYTQSAAVSTAINLYEYWAGRPDLGWGRYTVGRYGAGMVFSELDAVVHDNATIQIAKNALMDKIADRKVNLLQAFAERKQVERLLITTVKTVAQAASALKKGRVATAFKLIGFGSAPQVRTLLKGSKKEYYRKGNKTLSYRYDPQVLKTAKLDAKQMSDHWLAFQYGVRPLYGDVKGAAELIAQRHFSSPRRFVFRHKTSIEKKRRLEGLFYSGAYQVPGTYDRSEKTTAKYISVYELASAIERDFAQTGLSDLITLGWEVTPWSFVVDWALPIGDYLGRLYYSQGLTHVSTLQVLLSEMTGTLKPVGSYSRYSGTHGASLVRESSGSFSSNAIRLSRSIVGPVTAKFPEFKSPISPTHAANALALALTRLKVR